MLKVQLARYGEHRVPEFLRAQPSPARPPPDQRCCRHPPPFRLPAANPDSAKPGGRRLLARIMPVDMLQAPAALDDQFVGHVVKQLRMAGPSSHEAEVVWRIDDPSSEVTLPDAVDHDSRGQGVGRIRRSIRTSRERGFSTMSGGSVGANPRAAALPSGRGSTGCSGLQVWSPLLQAGAPAWDSADHCEPWPVSAAGLGSWDARARRALPAAVAALRPSASLIFGAEGFHLSVEISLVSLLPVLDRVASPVEYDVRFARRARSRLAAGNSRPGGSGRTCGRGSGRSRP